MSYPYCKMVDLSKWDYRSREVTITRLNENGFSRKKKTYYVESEYSVNRLELVINNCGEAQIELLDDLQIEFYFKPKSKLSDFSRKQLYDQAVADRRYRENREAARQGKR